MRLSKDKTTLIYNDFLTLSEIPKETYDYRLGNRSALEWVIDQSQPTSAAASPTIQIAPTTSSTSSASSDR
jgi:predicted helicase